MLMMGAVCEHGGGGVWRKLRDLYLKTICPQRDYRRLCMLLLLYTATQTGQLTLAGALVICLELSPRSGSRKHQMPDGLRLAFYL